jgi:hypothetical protein
MISWTVPPTHPEIALCNARCQTSRGAEERCPGSRSFLLGRADMVPTYP